MFDRAMPVSTQIKDDFNNNCSILHNNNLANLCQVTRQCLFYFHRNRRQNVHTQQWHIDAQYTSTRMHT